MNTTCERGASTHTWNDGRRLGGSKVHVLLRVGICLPCRQLNDARLEERNQRELCSRSFQSSLFRNIPKRRDRKREKPSVFVSFSLIHLTDVRGASRLATAGAAAWLVHSSSLTPYGLDGPTWGEIFFSSSENALVCQREREGSRALIPPFSMPKPKSVNIFRWCHHLTNYQMIFP